jgi:hypothetical protein
MVASIFLSTELPVTQCATNPARSGGAYLDDILRDPSWQAGPEWASCVAAKVVVSAISLEAAQSLDTRAEGASAGVRHALSPLPGPSITIASKLALCSFQINFDHSI